MRRRPFTWAWVFFLVLGGVLWAGHVLDASAESLRSLATFKDRRAAAEAVLPAVIAAGEAVAERVVRNPDARIVVPYEGQEAFAEELINRAGGLANSLPPNDGGGAVAVTLLSVRDWSRDAEAVRANIEKARARDSIVVLFASRADMPAGIQVDHLIDNGATDGSRDHAPDNVIINALHSWLWVCEYAAAMTRQGKYPGILLTIMLPGGEAFDGRLQRGSPGRTFVGQTETAIKPGVLSTEFLKRVDQLIDDLGSPRIGAQLSHAAGLIAGQLADGGVVHVTTCTHILMSEIFQDARTKMSPLHVVGQTRRAVAANVRPGDVVVWIGYIGMNTPYDDYAGAMRDAGARLVTCYVPDAKRANNASDAEAHIDQVWTLPDAAVNVPFPPGRIAPISGLNEALVYRMLEDAVMKASPKAVAAER